MKSDEVGYSKKGLPEIMVKAIMSLYEGVKTKIRVESGQSEEFFVKVDVHQGSVLLPLLFAMVVDELQRMQEKDGRKKFYIQMIWS